MSASLGLQLTFNSLFLRAEKRRTLLDLQEASCARWESYIPPCEGARGGGRSCDDAHVIYLDGLLLQ